MHPATQLGRLRYTSTAINRGHAYRAVGFAAAGVLNKHEPVNHAT